MKSKNEKSNQLITMLQHQISDNLYLVYITMKNFLIIPQRIRLSNTKDRIEGSLIHRALYLNAKLLPVNQSYKQYHLLPENEKDISPLSNDYSKLKNLVPVDVEKIRKN